MTQGKFKGLAALFRPTVKKHAIGKDASDNSASRKRAEPIVDVPALLKRNSKLEADNNILQRRVEWYEERYGKVQA